MKSCFCGKPAVPGKASCEYCLAWYAQIAAIRLPATPAKLSPPAKKPKK